MYVYAITYEAASVLKGTITQLIPERGLKAAADAFSSSQEFIFHGPGSPLKFKIVSIKQVEGVEAGQ